METFMLDNEPRDYVKIILGFWLLEFHFVINFFLIKNM